MENWASRCRRVGVGELVYVFRAVSCNVSGMFLMESWKSGESEDMFSEVRSVSILHFSFGEVLGVFRKHLHSYAVNAETVPGQVFMRCFVYLCIYILIKFL